MVFDKEKIKKDFIEEFNFIMELSPIIANEILMLIQEQQKKHPLKKINLAGTNIFYTVCIVAFVNAKFSLGIEKFLIDHGLKEITGNDIFDQIKNITLELINSPDENNNLH